MPSTTTITVSATSGGSVFVLATASSTTETVTITPYGTNYTQVPYPYQAVTIPCEFQSYVPNSQLGTVTNFTATSLTVSPGSNVITLANVNNFSWTVGIPIQFGQAFGNVLANTTYYVRTIESSNSITITSSLNTFAVVTVGVSIVTNLSSVSGKVYIQSLNYGCYNFTNPLIIRDYCFSNSSPLVSPNWPIPEHINLTNCRFYNCNIAVTHAYRHSRIQWFEYFSINGFMQIYSSFNANNKCN